ncbi:class I SAM-dependent methyltransferase [Luminiphilus syltensis]|uniref:class I SAM-dependent methyltransferase n=1 Tax=Luminiphilus syltensis TaxID=1341119 RepID=UPI0002E4086D|nr:methyltransferase domain-containing protein [Luminiphilus syltensis]
MSPAQDKTSKKTVKERRFRGVIMPTSSHPAIRRVKRAGHEPSIHGTKLWKSSCLIIDYLCKNPPPSTEVVLDAGCGWGVTGIWCAKKWQSSVISLDADPAVFPFLDSVANLNKVQTTPLVKRFEKLSKSELESVDILVAGDVCFWDELVKPVGKMIDRAIKAGVKKVIIADPERPPFHDMAERVIKRHGGELLEWQVKGKIKASGALLVIDNL